MCTYERRREEECLEGTQGVEVSSLFILVHSLTEKKVHTWQYSGALVCCGVLWRPVVVHDFFIFYSYHLHGSTRTLAWFHSVLASPSHTL